MAIIPAKQAEARRRNGRLSKGPKTAQGKAVSSRNALKYGLLSGNPLHPAESAEEFAAHRAKMIETFPPQNESERRLVETIIDTSWRLKTDRAD